MRWEGGSDHCLGTGIAKAKRGRETGVLDRSQHKRRAHWKNRLTNGGGREKTQKWNGGHRLAIGRVC